MSYGNSASAIAHVLNVSTDTLRVVVRDDGSSYVHGTVLCHTDDVLDVVGRSLALVSEVETSDTIDVTITTLRGGWFRITIDRPTDAMSASVIKWGWKLLPHIVHQRVWGSTLISVDRNTLRVQTLNGVLTQNEWGDYLYQRFCSGNAVDLGGHLSRLDTETRPF